MVSQGVFLSQICYVGCELLSQNRRCRGENGPQPLYIDVNRGAFGDGLSAFAYIANTVSKIG
jgi:hypothetical protein